MVEKVIFNPPCAHAQRVTVLCQCHTPALDDSKSPAADTEDTSSM